jgi:hypothetical protein
MSRITSARRLGVLTGLDEHCWQPQPPTAITAKEQAIFTHPQISHQIASDRHCDRIASTQQQQQLARQLRAQARASRPAGRAAQRLRRSLRIATARHT